MFTTVVLVLAVTIGVLLWSCRKRAPSKSFPPGPTGLPFLGYLPYLGPKPYKSLFKLRDKYGPVVSVQLGTKLVVVLNSLDVIKEALGKTAFSSRPSPMPFRIEKESIGFVDQSGPEWREQRQFSFRVLQNLGFGTIRMEDFVKDEILSLVEYLEKLEGQTVDLVEVITASVSNIINALIFGRRFELDDSKRKLLDTITCKLVPCFRQVACAYFLPEMVQTLFKFFSNVHREGKKYLAIQMQILEEEVRNHTETLENSHPRDYIDMYLLEMQKSKDKTTYFHKSNLMGNLRLLSAAGSDTVTATLQWAFIILAVFPQVQDKIQEEVDTVIGRDRTPSCRDQALMPYTQAAILEIHRWKTNLPLNVLRMTSSPSSVGGFELPANTIVIANLWSVHNDPELWESPQDFNPDRFLTTEGDLDYKKGEMLATFTYGPRSCPGKALANLEVFLFFVSVLQHFRLTIPEGVTPSLEGVLEISYKPLQTKLIFGKR